METSFHKNVLLPLGLTCRHLIHVFMPRIHLKRYIKVIKRANLSRRLKKKLEKYFMFRIKRVRMSDGHGLNIKNAIKNPRLNQINLTECK